MNEVIWEITEGRSVWRSASSDPFSFNTNNLDISDSVLSVTRIHGNVLGRNYVIAFFDESQSYYEFRKNRDKGYLALQLYPSESYDYIFTETKDFRDFNVGREKECALFITKLCNMVRVMNCAPPYPNKWKENG